MDEMENRYEIVRLKDGTYVLLDKENCYWLFGFAAGQKVWVELKSGDRLEGVIVKIVEEQRLNPNYRKPVTSYSLVLAYKGLDNVIVNIAEDEILDIGEWIIHNNEDIH